MNTVKTTTGPRKRNPLAKYPYLFLAPFLVIFFIFQFLPIVFTLGISFTRWDGINPMKFIGLENYRRLIFSDTRFFLTIFNTFVILLFSLPFTVVFSLVISHLMNSRYLRFKRVFELTNFLPYITTPVAIGLLWSILFDWKYGTVNKVLVSLGLIQDPMNWLGMSSFARIVVSLIVIWKNYGYLSILLLAGMSTIPPELYEAATVDGANSRQTFFHITIPQLRPILVFVVVTSVISGLQLFDEPFMLFKGGPTGAQPYGGPGLSCLTMVMNFYDAAFQYFDMGYGASIAYGMFVVIAFFSFLSLKFSMRSEKK